jgi:DNA-binding FadR family transcriptional regulator
LTPARARPQPVTPELAARGRRPERPPRAFDTVVAQLRDLVTSGSLQPGERLPSERSLAERFEVSRNTVREALRMLEVNGMITRRRGRNGGAFIVAQHPPSVIATTITHRLQLTDFSLQDLTDCMRWVCGILVVQVGPILTEHDLSVLEANTADAATLSPDDVLERARVLPEFFNLLARAGENPILVVVVESLTSILRDVVPRLGIDDHQFVIHARRRLLALLAARDIQGAVNEIDRYFVELHERWLERGAVPLRGSA